MSVCRRPKLIFLLPLLRIVLCLLTLQSGLALARDKPKTSLTFYDGCTQEPTRVMGFGGNKLKVAVEGLPPGAKLEIKVTLDPASVPEVEEERTRVYRRTLLDQRVNLRQLGRFESHHMVAFDRAFYRPKAFLWFYNAKVSWRDLTSGQTGEATEQIFIPPSQKEVIYVRSGLPICHWQTGTQLNGEYEHNPGDGMMVLSRHRILEHMNGTFRGFQDEEVDRNSNACWTGNAPFGIYFHSYNNFYQAAYRYGSFSQTWILSPEQGGYFGTRMSFNRYRVEKVAYTSPDQEGEKQCKTWRKVGEGYLDVGSRSLDFYVVPQSLTANPVEAAEFADSVRPPLNTCGDLFENGGQKYSIEESNGSMFYYPN